MTRVLAAAAIVLIAGAWPAVWAHDGPPFPIVTDRTIAGYDIAVWTDPDATDDGTAGGQFWVLLEATAAKGRVAEGTVVHVSVRPTGMSGEWQRVRADPLQGRVSRQFAALVMDHEGRFDVRVEIDGPLGAGEVTAWVDATYDLRPPPILLLVYLMPFVILGGIWVKLLARKHRAARERQLHRAGAATSARTAIAAERQHPSNVRTPERHDVAEPATAAAGRSVDDPDAMRNRVGSPVCRTPDGKPENPRSP